MNTDTTALQERLVLAMYDITADQWAHLCSDERAAGLRRLAMEQVAAVLPIIAAEVRAASEKAWDDGESSGLTEAAGGHGWPNPYRTTETGDRA